MGGERASTTRQREKGLICALCSSRIPISPGESRAYGERICMDCERRIAFRAGRHYEVLMNFQLRDRWAFHFIAADCKTPISSFFNLRSLEELRALVIRTDPPASILEEFDRNVRAWGRGSVTLFVTAKQLVSIIRGGRR